MTAVYAALLGVVQGLTEFLPISSSAHLILARAMFGWNAEQFGLSFDVACHVGTLLAVLAFFRVELRAMVAALPEVVGASANAPAQLVRLIVVGTVPIVLIGLLFGPTIEDRLRTPGVALVALAIGALALLAAERWGARVRGEESLTLWEALLVGAAQAAALVPGVSRSGATIAAAVLLGLRRDAAARFGFLLGVPAVIAAAAREGAGLAGTGLDHTAAALFAIGVVSSALVGYVTVKYFIRYLTRHSLDVFALYRLVLAAGGALWLL